MFLEQLGESSHLGKIGLGTGVVFLGVLFFSANSHKLNEQSFRYLSTKQSTKAIHLHSNNSCHFEFLLFVPQKNEHVTWKILVGRQAFPFEMDHFYWDMSIFQGFVSIKVIYPKSRPKLQHPIISRCHPPRPSAMHVAHNEGHLTSRHPCVRNISHKTTQSEGKLVKDFFYFEKTPDDQGVCHRLWWYWRWNKSKSFQRFWNRSFTKSCEEIV